MAGKNSNSYCAGLHADFTRIIIFLGVLDGNVTAGLSFTKSNGIGQVNFSASVQYATKHMDYQLMTSSIGSIDSGSYSRDNENIQHCCDLMIWGRPGFSPRSFQYQRNLELSISHGYP